MRTSLRGCKLSAADWRVIREVDRRLERDLWLAEYARSLEPYGKAPAEVLATAKNPSRQQLQAERFTIGLSGLARRMGISGWGHLRLFVGNAM